MKIESSNLAMESTRTYTSIATTSHKFSIIAAQGSGSTGDSLLGNAADSEETALTSSDGQGTSSGSVTTLEEWKSRFGISTQDVSLRATEEETTVEKLKQEMLALILQLLFPSETERKEWMDRFGISESGNATSGASALQSAAGLASSSNMLTAGVRVLGYSYESTYSELEETSFAATGKVVTSDGRELSFGVNIGMSRSFSTYYAENIEMASFSLCDPLVLNFDTNMTELSDMTFYFDIDGDGEKEEISQLGKNSGYLALDRDDNGTIDDGSELFGTVSGDGFADLAAYDDDGNGWIDENDAIWSRLKVWSMNEDGSSTLYRLSDKGVGAICLQRVNTEFTLQNGADAAKESYAVSDTYSVTRSADNVRTQGVIRSTGLFLYENGTVGTLQHVDVAAYEANA